MTTLLNDTLFSNIEIDEKEVNMKDKSDTELISLFNEDLSSTQRKELISELYNRDKNLIIECVNSVINSYSIRKNSLMKGILMWLINNKEFNFPIRIRCIECLDEGGFSEDLYLMCLEHVKDEDLTFKRKYEVGTTYFWNIFKGVIKRDLSFSDSLIERLTNIWKSIVFDYLLEEGFRYKLLQSICNESTFVEDIRVDNRLKFAFSDLSLNVKWEDYRYYIYIIQFIIKTDNLESKHLDILINIVKERKLDNNGIADISDFLIGIKENNSSHLLFDNIEKYITLGKEMLDSISFDGKGVKTIYNNSQNIHKIDVEGSINPFIEKLVHLEINIPTDEEEYSKFVDNIIDNIKDYSDEVLNMSAEEQIRIINSINRFLLDNTIYSKYSVSLINLLIRSYYYIQTHPSRDELMLRLCQELCDMADTCTTGHIYRIVNVFSAYEVSLTLPVEEEIKSCVYARLQKIISSKSEEEQELIFECIGSSEDIKMKEKKVIDTTSHLIGEEYAMVEHDTQDEEREYIIKGKIKKEDINKNNFLVKSEDPEIMFNTYLGKDISILLDELRGEYSNVLSEQELDLHFRKAISLFQLGEM